MRDCRENAHMDMDPHRWEKSRPKKPIFNFCLLVILPMLIVLTILIMFLTYLFFWMTCNTVSEEDKAISDSDTLIKCSVLQAEESGEYYEVFMRLPAFTSMTVSLWKNSEFIAFCVPEERLDEIPYMQGSYYPVAYWHGSYQTMDLTQGFNIINSGYYGSNDLDFQSRLTQVKVYDFSAYRGHTQSMGRGVGIAVVIFWLAELCIAGAFIFLDLIGGLIIFSINRDRKKLYKKTSLL